ncbi:MAG: hypothetical protein K2K64_06085 [Muribaculaceae bacterium]|nr:hypothetical protein [Muribaculaceae bacterium]MDE7109570.1 hypothetical protein [Muribaculaceae bacterium]
MNPVDNGTRYYALVRKLVIKSSEDTDESHLQYVEGWERDGKIYFPTFYPFDRERAEMIYLSKLVLLKISEEEYRILEINE